MISRMILYMLEPKPLSRPAACRCFLVRFLALERHHCNFAQASWDAVGSILRQDMGLCWQEHRKWKWTACIACVCLLSLGYLQHIPSFQACNLLSVCKISRRGDGMCRCMGCIRGKSLSLCHAPLPPLIPQSSLLLKPCHLVL